MDTIRCKNCGYELFPSDTICDKCGTSVVTGSNITDKDINTTKRYYYFCNRDTAEKRRQIEKAINF